MELEVYLVSVADVFKFLLCSRFSAGKEEQEFKQSISFVEFQNLLGFYEVWGDALLA